MVGCDGIMIYDLCWSFGSWFFQCGVEFNVIWQFFGYLDIKIILIYVCFGVDVGWEVVEDLGVEILFEGRFVIIFC